MTLTAVNNFFSRLDAPDQGLGQIALSGEDARQFLHNQISNDVEHMTPDEARLAAYCSPKGRMLASFLLWQTDDILTLQLPRDILPAIQKRLQMFVMRAKVKLSDESANWTTFGLFGPALSQVFAQLPAKPYAVLHDACGVLIRLEDLDGMPRCLCMSPAGEADALMLRLRLHLQELPASDWRLTDIRAGVPHVGLATQDQFFPQMLNFELIGGVNFKKGCYPGQEIVARSQYLGKLKRRMLLARVAGQTAPGTEVFSALDPEQPCGMIVNAESHSANESTCLVALKLAAVQDGAIHLGSADGAILQFDSLPYPLTDPA